MNPRKYNYYKIIQQNCGKWEDVSHYETDSRGYADKETRDLIKHDFKEYLMMGYATRIIFRREHWRINNENNDQL